MKPAGERNQTMEKSAQPDKTSISSNLRPKTVPSPIPKNNDCKFKNCEHDVYKNNFCIFHLPKLTAEEKEKLTPDQAKEYQKIENDFREAFYKLLKEKEEDPINEECDFSNFQFVKIDLSAGKLEEVLGRRFFQKDINFYAATFNEEVSFRKTEFKKSADFSWSKLNRADFSWSKFQEANFNSSKFQSAKFAKSEFLNAIFIGSKIQSANFREAKFQNADFSWTEFQSAIFSESEFQRAKFGLSKFQSADYSNSKFKKSADFIESEFQDANFSRSNFQNAEFILSKFQNASFMGSLFQNANFSWSEFQNANFFSAEFQNVDFSGANFLKKATFQGHENIKCFLGECSFENVEIDRNALVAFQKVRLGQTSFTDTDLEKIVFRDVDWCDPEKLQEAKKKFRFWHVRKQALWDEFRPLGKLPLEGKRDYEKIAENYRQLVLNYERKRDFDTAEQFHIGEMEMRRKKQGTAEAPWRRRFMKLFQIKRKTKQQKILEHWNSYNLYRLLSNYGTSYWHALLVLLLLVLLLSSGFLITGFSPVGASNGKTIEAINYVWAWPWECSFQLKQRAIDLAEAVTFSFSILTFQHSKLYEPSGSLTRLLICMAVICFYSQTALVLLAIRRKFKR